MKLKTLIALAFIATTMTSCLNDTYDPQPLSYFTISSIVSEQVGQSPVKHEFGWGNLNSTSPIVLGEFQTKPFLIEHTIIGSSEETDVSKLHYKYTNTAITITTTIAGDDIIDSLKLDQEKYMAYQLYTDGVAGPYRISYDDFGYRSKVDDMEIKYSSTSIYRNCESVSKNGSQIIKYEYSSNRQFIGLQQYGIIGEEHSWATDRFGYQNANLLSTMYRMEDDVEVKYTYSYVIDNYGLVKEEIIKRNDQDFMTNKYVYGIITVNPK